MQIHCPQCGRPLTAVELDLTTRAARCGACHAAVQLPQPIQPYHFTVRQRHPVPTMPAGLRGVRLHDDGLTRTISLRWYTHTAWLAALFVAYMTGLFSLGLAGTLADENLAGMTVFGGLECLALAAAYGVATLFVNRTYISLRAGVLRVRHGPLPWCGRVRIDASRIRRFCIRRAHGRDKSGERTVCHSLHAVLDDGSRRRLLRYFDDHGRAVWIRSQLESWPQLTRPSAATGAHRLAS